MANETVITELIIDARPSEAGSAAYVKAMKSAEAAQAKFIAGENAATVAMEKSASVMKMTSGSISSTAKAWERLKSSVDPAYQATQRMERALLTADSAAKKLGVDQSEVNRVMDLARAKHMGGAVAVEEGAVASRLGASQLASLGHAARSAAESLAMGQSPSMVLTQQMNHLSFAMSGPQGIIAASAGVRAAFGTWLTTLPGILSTAGVAAVGAVAVYMAATREDILSVDEILEGHKKLLDEVANTYPHLTEALKKYADEAAKLPQSVLAADAATQIENDQRSLAASLDHLKVDLRDLARASDVVGSAGSEAFGKLADTIDAGNVNVDKLVASVGDIRMDPSLTPDARHFADGLQAAVNEAKKLADTLAKDQGIKSIGPDGKAAEATLFDISKGLKNVGTSAHGSSGAVGKLLADLKAGGGSLGALTGIDPNVRSLQSMAQASALANQQQLQTLVSYNNELRNTKLELISAHQAIASAASTASIQDFLPDVANIKGAQAAISSATGTIDKLFSSMRRGGASAQMVADGIDTLRNALIQGGLPVGPVNAFIDAFVAAEMQVDSTTSSVNLLERAIQQLHDKTINITTVYSVVGGGSVSVQRPYSGPGGLAQQPHFAPAPATPARQGSLYDSVKSIALFATGGFTGHAPTDRVAGLVHGQEYVFDAKSTAAIGVSNLEAIRRGVPGHDAGGSVGGAMPLMAGADRLKSIEENTFQTVEEIKRSVGYLETMEKDGQTGLSLLRAMQSAIKSSASSAGSYSGGSSSGGGSGGMGGSSQQNPFRYVGGVFYPGNGGFAYQNYIAWEKAKHGGFATGGAIHPGDTQKVEAWKRPDEAVAFFRPEQRAAVGDAIKGGGKTVNMGGIHIHMPAGSSPASKQSQAELADRFRRVVRDEIGAL
ncbi:hypothetical protein NKH54_12395 [Mesorhizobium sp. M1004]|uniref:hypothetical protein n=1 Tax=Mesorhizobium sp. M1004 TaxID=2957046 RepID=UPI00333DC25E